MGVWTWARDTFNSVCSYFSNAYTNYKPIISNAASTVFSRSGQVFRFAATTVKSFFSDAKVKNYLYAVTKQGWFGFGRVFVFLFSTVLFDKDKMKTREVLGRHSFINSQQLGFIIANGITLQALFSALSESESVYGKGALYTIYSLSAIAQVFAFSVSVKLLYENMMLNVATSAIITNEDKALTNEHYKPCGHDPGALLSGGIESVLEYYAALVVIKLLSYVPGLYWPTLIAEIFINGRSMAELKYASLGTCAEDRRKILKELNAFSSGVGISFEAFTRLVCLAIEVPVAYLLSLVGIKYVSIEQIRPTVQTILYPYFAAAIISIKDPIPPFDDKKNLPQLDGKDYLWFPRYIKDGLVTLITDAIKTKETNHQGKEKTPAVVPVRQQNQDSQLKAWIGYMQAVRNYTNDKLQHYPKLALLKYIVTFDPNNDWSSVEAFLANYENKLFFDTYYHAVKLQLEGIAAIHNKGFSELTWGEVIKRQAVHIIPGLPSWFSQFLVSEEYKQLLRKLFSKDFKDPLNTTIEMLNKIHGIQKLAVAVEEQREGLKMHDRTALAAANDAHIYRASADDEEYHQAKKQREMVVGLSHQCGDVEKLQAAIEAAVTTGMEMPSDAPKVTIYTDLNAIADAANTAMLNNPTGASSSLRQRSLPQRDAVSAAQLTLHGFNAFEKSQSAVESRSERREDSALLVKSASGINQAP